MISVFLMGGLGNTMFQIAALIAHCIQHRRDFVLPYSETLETGQPRPTYWTTFFQDLRQFTTVANPDFMNAHLFGLPRYHESQFHYSPLPPNIDNTMLWGYFQSPRYFDHYRDQVLQIMGVTQRRNKIRTEFAELLGTLADEPTISVHFRLGDYKHKQEFHPVLPYEYYDRAFANLPQDLLQRARILYFCEEEDRAHVDVVMLRLYQTYGTRPPICVDHVIPDWKQMLIMSHCRVNIIANSSYSWWGAYLNQDPQKQVMYPSRWFGPAISHDVRDMFPADWVKVVV